MRNIKKYQEMEVMEKTLMNDTEETKKEWMKFFLEERTSKGDNYRVLTTILYKEYQGYLRDNSAEYWLQSTIQKQFVSDMETFHPDIIRRRTSLGNTYLNLCLKCDENSFIQGEIKDITRYDDHKNRIKKQKRDWYYRNQDKVLAQKKQYNIKCSLDLEFMKRRNIKPSKFFTLRQSGLIHYIYKDEYDKTSPVCEWVDWEKTVEHCQNSRLRYIELENIKKNKEKAPYQNNIKAYEHESLRRRDLKPGHYDLSIKKASNSCEKIDNKYNQKLLNVVQNTDNQSHKVVLKIIKKKPHHQRLGNYTFNMTYITPDEFKYYRALYDQQYDMFYKYDDDDEERDENIEILESHWEMIKERFYTHNPEYEEPEEIISTQ